MRRDEIDPAWLRADFWIERCGEDCGRLRSLSDIHAFNERWARTEATLCDVCQRADTPVQETDIRSWIERYGASTEGMTAADGSPPDPVLWANVFDNRQVDRLSASASVFRQPRYGFAVGRVSVRSQPTAEALHRSGSARFDQLQETALHTFEPILIWHESRDSDYLFVQSWNYRGWVATDDVALADRDTFLRYCSWPRLLYVTGLGIEAKALGTLPRSDGEGQSYPLDFAARLPLLEGETDGGPSRGAGFRVHVPVRGADGRMVVRPALVAADADVSIGPLPLTRASVIRQAFKLLGEPYGWGDSDGHHDCSSLVQDAYRAHGLDLPRNTGDQERIGDVSRHDFAGDASTLERLGPGDPLYMPGHVMIYLGKQLGRHYIIHDYAGYSEPNDSGGWTFAPVYRVMVSSLDILLRDGRSYLQALTTGLSFF